MKHEGLPPLAKPVEPPKENPTTTSGYTEPPKTETPKPVEPPKDEPAKPTIKSGYEDPKTEPPKPVEPPKDEPAKPDADISLVLKDLPQGYDREAVTKFAIDNKLTKEQAQAYVKFAQDEFAQIKKNHEAKSNEIKVQWTNELKSDQNFGGENFSKNVHAVENLIENHLPNMKKALTERGGMLPPYIMKDLLNLHKLLNPTASLVNGEPSIPAKDDDDFLTEMYPNGGK
jgi:hypothetical protein